MWTIPRRAALGAPLVRDVRGHLVFRSPAPRSSLARRRTARGVVLISVLSLGLTIGAPVGAVTATGRFPLARLWSWIEAQVAWSAPLSPLPAQERGTAKGHPHYVGAAATAAHTGIGHAPKPAPHGLLPYQAPKLSVSPTTGRPIAGDHSFDPVTSRRVASLSTANTDTFQNADGSYTRRVYQRPVNFEAADGSWQPIDSHLVRRADDRLYVAANSMQISVAQTIARPDATGHPASDTTDVASVRLVAGQSVGWRLAGAAPVVASVTGSTATYPGILPFTDLRLIPFQAGLHEQFVLRSPDAPSSWLFRLDLNGLAAHRDADGAVSLLDASGRAVARFAPGRMQDSQVNPVNGAAAGSSNVTFALVTGPDGRPALQVTADSAWLHDPTRAYPVTVEATTTTGDVRVDPSGASSDANGDDIAIGTLSGGTDKAPAFVDFDAFDASLAGHRVAAVSLKAYLSWSSSCQDHNGFDVSATTPSRPGGHGLTSPSPAIGAPIGRLTQDPGVACTNTSGNRSVGVWETVPLSTATFADRRAGSSSGQRLALTTDANGVKRFTSADYLSGQYAPALFVTFTANVPPQIDSVYPSYGYQTSTLSPQLLVYAHDPDLNPNTMTYDFKVYNAANALIKDSGWQPSNAYVVPSGVLVWGRNFSWTVQANDGLTTSAVLPKWALSTAVPQPPITSGLAQNGGQGFDPSGSNYTTSATDATVASVGPSLSVERDYNSQDPRVASAFGAGWASVVDAKATEQKDAGGTVETVVVTYPAGQEVAYGRNANNTFVPPPSRFATFKSVTGGYQLTDKDGTTYVFTTATSVAGQYGLTSISDAQNRRETFTYSANRLATMTGASLRALHFTWSTPAGATAAHVATVVTDPAVAGNPATALTWTYTYTGDLLTKVCSPVSAVKCATYAYGAGSQYPSAVMNAGPASYWRLGESSGPTAVSAVIGNEGADNATYTGVQLGQSGPLPGSAATAVTLTGGSTASVKLPESLIAASGYQSISMWFKTAPGGNGILFSYNTDPITKGTTSAYWTPALYVGLSGKLYGELYVQGQSTTPMMSTAAVNTGAWHHVVLAGAGSTQSMYIDGVKVATKAGAISTTVGTTNEYIGAGFNGGGWPDEPKTGIQTGYAMSFNGSISEVATFDRSLTDPEVAALYGTGHVASAPLTQLTRPTGKIAATMVYDPASTRLTQVTDGNGGVWKLNPPSVTGSSQVYVSSALAGLPADYWRLGETGVTDAVNQVNGNTATYSGVTLGQTDGPFQDATVAKFNGTSDYLAVPSADVPTTNPVSIGMWFKMPANSAAGGVLFSYQAIDMAGDTGAPGDWTPALYVGTDGKLRGEIYNGDSTSPMTSIAKVNDGNWHHVAITATASSQALYLDGAQVASITRATVDTGVTHAYVGVGKWSGGWPAHSAATFGYWPGEISEVAYFNSTLSAAQVGTQYAARAKSNGVPVKTVTVTTPHNATVTHVYDMATGRQLSETDALGNTTSYGYDVGGFVNTATDPRGDVTTTTQDVRGNTVAATTCQDYSLQKCSTIYYTYYPDDTSTTLTPDPRNDMVLTMRDGRSSGPTDNTYLTTYTYDALGNRTSVAEPLGRTTATAYTDGTSVAAQDGGFAPAGLPAQATMPGGAVQKMVYFHNGDLASVTEPAGAVAAFTYDALGRVLTNTKTTDTFPSGLTTTFTYNAAGQVLTEADPAITDRVTGATHTAVTTTSYDDDGLVLSQTTADTTGGDASRTLSKTYNTYDQIATQTDAVGKVDSLWYDQSGNMIKQVAPDGTETDTAYDANDNVLTTTLKGYIGDPNNPSAPTDLITLSNAYDPAGRLASKTDANGWTTSYTYTDNGLVSTSTRNDGTHAFVLEQNTYDGDGHLTSQVTSGATTTTTRVYNASGQLTSSVLDPAGLNRITSYAYNVDGQPTSVTSTDATGTLSGTDTMYDLAGRPLATTVTTDPFVPVARWKLNETAGTTAADSTGNNAGTTSTGVTWSSAHGGSAAFTGTGAITAGPSVDTARSFTVSAWVYLTSSAATSVAVAQRGMQQSGFDLRYDQGANKWGFARWNADVVNPSSKKMASSNAAPTLNSWTHLLGVFDAATGKMTLYVNGTAQTTTATDTTPFATTGPTVIGRGYYNGIIGNNWNGSISDVQIYSRTLSVAEASSVYGGTGPTPGAHLLRTTVGLDRAGLATYRIDPNGNRTDFGYDEEGNQVVVTGPAVMAETNGGTPMSTRPVSYVGFDTFGEAVETKDPNGNVTLAGYDAAGRLTSTRLPSYTPPGGTVIVATSTQTYDSMGRPWQSFDAYNHETDYAHDQFGNVSKVTTPDGRSTTYTYDTLGDQLSATDPSAAVTAATYDYLGRKVTTTQVVRQTSTNYTANYYYGTDGRLSQVKSPAGVNTYATYDPAGEVLTRTDGAGNITRFAYDGLGRQTKTTRPDGTYTTAIYDRAGRVTATKAFDAVGTQLSGESSTYDNNGNVLTATDARNTVTIFAYDPTGLLVSEVQPITAIDSITTTFGYDLAGNRTRFTDGRGNRTITTYNTWNLPESLIEPATPALPNPADGTFTTAYDAMGRVANQTSPGGVTVTDSYDVMSNLLTAHGSGADAPTADRTFGYDNNGRVTSATGPAGADTFSYDDRGLLLTADGVSGTSSFGYSADGAVTSRVDAGGTTSYTYDTDGRLATVANMATGVNLSIGYNPVSLPTTMSYGTSSDVRSLGYDTMHRLTADEVKTNGGASVAKIVYGYDANSNETSKTTTGFTGSAANIYTYDLANRLTSWNDGTTTTPYAYDKSGNRTQTGSKLFTYDARNQLRDMNGTTFYYYTQRGTLSSTVAGSITQHTTNDAFGQTITQDATTGGTTQTYSYDAFGRVIQAGLAYSGAGNTLASDGTTTYTRDPGDGLVGESSAGVNRLAFTDQHIDVVGQFAATGTTLTGSTTYDPLGNVTTGVGMIGHLGYQSEWTDSLTGRVDMAARWYNPATGQFDNRDSANLSATPASVAADRYAYGDDNPLTVTDPTGHLSSMIYADDVSIASHPAQHSEPAARRAPTPPRSSYHEGHDVNDGHASGHGCVRLEGMNGPCANQVNSPAARQRLKEIAAQDAARARQQAKWEAQQKKNQQFYRTTIGRRTGEESIAAAAVAENEARASGAPPAYTKPKKKHCGWDIGCQIRQHKAEIMGFVVGAVVGLGCGALIGWTGVGAVACGALAGAAGAFVTGAMEGHSGWQLVGDVLIGGTIGAVTGGLFSIAGRALGAGVRAGIEDGLGAGMSAVRQAGKDEIGNIVKGFANPRSLLSNAREGLDSLGSNLRNLGRKIVCHSFDPATPVLMANGTTKPIKDVQVGDTVTSTDPVTGQTLAKPVTVLHVNHDTDLADVTVKNTKTGATTVLHTTWHHPFWGADVRRWVEAKDLAVGTTLRSPDGATAEMVTAVKIWTGLHWMRDLTVGEIHTYYVVAGDTPVLVHNCGGSIGGHKPTCDCANGGAPIGPRNGGLAGGTHPNTGVPFDADGFPDFSAWRHPDVPDVRIDLAGNRSTDFARANAAAGLDETPGGYAWHHHQDCGLMQLIEIGAHAMTGHTGGFSIC
jgi:RHS repeat-associated protein